MKPTAAISEFLTVNVVLSGALLHSSIAVDDRNPRPMARLYSDAVVDTINARRFRAMAWGTISLQTRTPSDAS
jgi:hypothetical protein